MSMYETIPRGYPWSLHLVMVKMSISLEAEKCLGNTAKSPALEIRSTIPIITVLLLKAGKWTTKAIDKSFPNLVWGFDWL